ncbi:MAG: sigma-70 family RNA polymerase sigma factor [Parapedobacter sp.]|nr:MAG: sigma-70 family RNA polymerase sigma factor [Parapedobacter sp.]
MSILSASENESRELVSRLKNGDKTAFEQIYHLHKIALAANLLRILKSPEVVEDILQQLFMTLWETRQNIDPDRPIAAYLYRIGRNLATDIFRRALRDKNLRLQLLPSIARSYTHIEESIDEEENKSLLYSVLDKLPPKRRQVFVLCKIENKSYRDVGEMLDISENTVNDHIREANKFIKKHLT